jgi:hypothetical protein
MVRTKVISIPLWCDWKQLSILHKAYRCDFNSFMVRLEETSDFIIPLLHDRHLQYISIPLWCDWKLVCQGSACLIFHNSFMVRLEVLPNVENSVFQFLYGAIGSLDQSHLFLYGAIGSSHLQIKTVQISMMF